MERIGSEKKDTDLLINPSLYGVRGNQGIKGSVHNISFDNLHASDFIRAYVKGMAEELYNMYAAFPEEIRKGRSEIAASGNGIRLNPLMAEETAKRFGMPVIFGKLQEEAAAGAAKAALELLF